MKSREGKSQKKKNQKGKSKKRRQERRRLKKIKEEKVRQSWKKEDAGVQRRCRCAKRGELGKHCVFPMTCGSRGSKSRLAEAAGAEPAGERRDKKLHAVVARSTLRSQNVKNTACLDHFWTFTCRKKCTPLWREANFQIKMCKAQKVRSTFRS